MATSREERMQQRMRGAGRHEVADISFGFVLPVEEPVEEPAEPSPVAEEAPVSATRSTPNTSAKRRRLNAQPSPTRPQSVVIDPRSSQQPSNASKPDPYDIRHGDGQSKAVPTPRHKADASENVQGTPSSSPQLIRRPTPRSSKRSPAVVEEVTESPYDAPGSGHRRRIGINNALTQSAQLQRAVLAEEANMPAEPTTSSPLARKTRKSGTTPSAVSARSTGPTPATGLAKAAEIRQETPEITRRPRRSNSTIASSSSGLSSSGNRRSVRSSLADDGAVDELSSPIPLAENRRKTRAKSRVKRDMQPLEAPEEQDETVEVEEAELEENEEPDAEEAEEIDDNEAARHIGKKRPRSSLPREESPELSSQVEETARPTKKRRQKQTPGSPAKQSQPKPKAKVSQRRRSNGEAIPIQVQRYTRPFHHNEDDTDGDILNSEIPFANRSGVNVVDVLMQMCDEVIESNLETLMEAARNTQEPAARKEYRIKLRALEAFQSELQTRLLEHTVALDSMHALQKRVRSVQKEKLALRSEIVRIRAEREQVALKMDAVRIRHETERNQSLQQLNISSTMHDIDLAIENGRAAPELSPKEQRTADLANLELLIARVADQTCGGIDGSGTLKQIQDFNAFLERAAATLEAR